MPYNSANRAGSHSSSRAGPKLDHPTTRCPSTKTNVARSSFDKICVQNCSRWSTESRARSSSGTMPACAARQERTCTSAIPRASRGSASRMITILSHYRNLIQSRENWELWVLGRLGKYSVNGILSVSCSHPNSSIVVQQLAQNSSSVC